MKQLDEIRERLAAATPGPWKADTVVRGDCVVWGPNGRFLMNAQAEPHWLEYPGEKRSVAFDVDKRDVEFIAHARHGTVYDSDDGETKEMDYCETCSDSQWLDEASAVAWPCPTVAAITQALEGQA